jgi:hypothetical protein
MAGLVKQGGNLYEASGEELNSQQQAATLPTTPAGAAAQGANPDEAKMVGTQANKESTLKKIVTPDQSLQQAKREQQTVQERPLQPSNVEAAEKLNRIKSIGSIESQLEARIQQKLDDATAQQAQLQVEAATIEALPVAQQVQAQELINKYTESLQTGGLGGQQLVAMSKLLGREVTPAEMQGWFQDSASTLGGMVQESLPATLTMADVGLSELGDVNAIANDLGVTPEELNSYTLEQLQQKIQDVESQEYNRVQNLQAQLPGATGARREQILRELGSEAQVGTTGVEAQFDRIQKDIDEASTIDVAGEEFTLAEILEDDGLSEFIEEAVRSPEALKKLEETAPALAEWVKNNIEGLKQLGADVQASGEAFGVTQDEVRNIKSSIGSPELASSIFGEVPEYMTAEDAAAFKAKVEANPIIQAMGDDDWLRTELTRNPKLAAQLKDMNKETIVSLAAASQKIRSNPNIAAMLGIEGGEFITDKSLLTDIDYISGIATKAPGLLEDSTFRNAYINGTIDKSVVNILANNPDEWQDVNEGIKISNQLAEIGDDLDGLVNYMFGGVGVDELNASMTTLRNKAMIGDKNAEKEYNRLVATFGDSVGKEDIGKLKAMAGDSTSLAKGGKTLKESTSPLMDSFNKSSIQGDDWTTRVMPMIEDGKINTKELSSMSWEEQDKLLSNPKMIDMLDIKTRKGEKPLTAWKRQRDWALVEQGTKDFTRDFNKKIRQSTALRNLDSRTDGKVAQKDLNDTVADMYDMIDDLPKGAPRAKVEMRRLIDGFKQDWEKKIKDRLDAVAKAAKKRNDKDKENIKGLKSASTSVSKGIASKLPSITKESILNPKINPVGYFK